MNLYYDRQGNAICQGQWAHLFEQLEYKRVAYTVVGPYVVSTVWIGIDHDFTGHGPPIIFETMVFPEGSWNELDMRRYRTEEEALIGHVEMVKATEELVKKDTE